MARTSFPKAALVLMTIAPVAAWAAGAHDAALKETDTAIAHAGMALGAHELEVAHMHLHHVLNCLAGPGGKGFDAAFADPCKGMGQGALRDAAGDARVETALRRAAAEAEQGLKATRREAAQADARRVLHALQDAAAAH